MFAISVTIYLRLFIYFNFTYCKFLSLLLDSHQGRQAQSQHVKKSSSHSHISQQSNNSKFRRTGAAAVNRRSRITAAFLGL